MDSWKVAENKEIETMQQVGRASRMVRTEENKRRKLAAEEARRGLGGIGRYLSKTAGTTLARGTLSNKSCVLQFSVGFYCVLHINHM